MAPWDMAVLSQNCADTDAKLKSASASARFWLVIIKKTLKTHHIYIVKISKQKEACGKSDER